MSVNPATGPQLLAPADGAIPLSQPSNPPLLAWSPVSGATSYEVEVDTEADFIGASSYITYTTSKVVPDPKVDGQYFWRVRAQMAQGILSQWSAVRTFRIGALSQVTPTLPVDDVNAGVADVVFDWEPIPGAREYQLRIDNDEDFNSVTDLVTVQSTRYSPPTTYRNDQYYWQVRAVNLNGEFIDWDSVEIRSFKRHWPDRPSLVYPLDSISEPVGDDFYYQWTPVRHASHYRLELGSDPNFSPGTYVTCSTNSTTYTPGSPIGEACMPSQGRVYYWRVLPFDAPGNIPGIYSDIHAFTYDSGQVTQLSPLQGATVSVPTLRWQASKEADSYLVLVKNDAGAVVASTSTFALSWTPTAKLDPAQGPFVWTVQAKDADGRISPLYAGESFMLEGEPAASGLPALTPISPGPGELGTNRFPGLSWEPKAGAAYYRVSMAVHTSPFKYPDNESPLLSSPLAYPAATDWASRFMTPGKYDWWITAYDNAGTAIGTGPRATFEILDLDEVGGQQVALTGAALDAGAGCTAFLADTSGAETSCENMPTTPVLDWESVPEASYYMIYVARDRSFTTMTYTGVETTNSRWTPSHSHGPSALPDSQAGQAYYWFIRPCKTRGSCGPDPLSTSNPAGHGFSKQSPAVSLVSPATGAVVANDVGFRWEDYRTTNEEAAWGPGSEVSQQSGQRYHIQISTRDNFSGSVWENWVDQSTYTPYNHTLPEGTLYWRVQALDGQGNGLQWSAVRTFTKRSPVPALLSPTSGSSAASTPAFRWDPLSFAGQYQVEVYRDGDTAFSPSNLVISGPTKQSAFTHATPLAPSTKPYVWRVRRIDSGSHVGGWSATASFYVRRTTPRLGYPASGTYVNGRDAYFTWGAVPGATAYRFERRITNAASLTESVTTSARGWAPTSAITNGSWQWRVTALNVNGHLVGSTSWRSFRVDSSSPRVVTRSPVRTAARTANFVARFNERVRGLSGSTMKFYVRGRGRALPARVTLSRDGRTATLNPSRNLRRGKVYTVKLSASIRDSAGNALRATSWTVRAR